MLALLLIFAVMASIFESVRQAITLLVALPFALAGAFWTLWLTGTDFAELGLLEAAAVAGGGAARIETASRRRQHR